MAICRACYHKVMRKSENPDFFKGRDDYKYYCEECDLFMNINSVAYAVIISSKITYIDLEANPKTGD